jgi:hypothetical protein
LFATWDETISAVSSIKLSCAISSLSVVRWRVAATYRRDNQAACNG